MLVPFTMVVVMESLPLQMNSLALLVHLVLDHPVLALALPDMVLV